MSMQVHIPDPHYRHLLLQELKNIIDVSEHLIITEPQEQLPVFALDTWLTAEYLSFESISDAAKQLKQKAVYWTPYLNQFARRSVLISEQLRRYKLEKMYPFPLPVLPSIAQFSLVDAHRLVFTTERSKAIPSGVFHFIENKEGPPNRAYLKLWEALSILQIYPQAGELALDLGASPGGWTYVLQQFGTKVIAVDKAPLDPHIARLPGVTYQPISAFSLRPQDVDHIDWFVCDMACYPDKLYTWLLPWIASEKVSHFIVTIKLQGLDDFASIRPFQSIPNARVLHLQHNKHEVTLLLSSNDRLMN